MATQQWVAIRRFRSRQEGSLVPPPPRRQPNRDRSGPPRSDRPAPTDRPARTDRPVRSGRPARPGQPTEELRRPRFVEPPLADEVDYRDLDRGARAGLRSLPKDLAEKIGRHLVAAGQLLDEDPATALAHAQYARNLAPRLAVVREGYGVAAYVNGEYATALTELRAVRRMTGDASYLPIMADCERGLARPERALALASDPDVAKLAPAERVELAIVASGARRDRGEAKAAVVALQGPDLERSDVQPWTVRLWYAYAVALTAAGRTDEARQWFESVVTIDEDEETDAAERLEELAAD
jgi:tetratricopeptide (TPR) repeat protein